MKKIYKILGIALIISILFVDVSVYAVEEVVNESIQNVEEGEVPEEEPKESMGKEGEDSEADSNASRNTDAVLRTQKNEIVDSSEKKVKKRTATKDDLYEAEKTGLENSWRYKDGEFLKNTARTKQYTTWPEISRAVSYGIDVSYHNGVIDWAKAKKAGVDYAIIRCGYGMNQTDQDDKQWKNNVQGCIENDIPFGVYIYSYATTTERAKSEAEHVLRLVKGYDMAYPIYLDLEDSSTPYEDKKKMGDIAETFCNIIKKAGYEVGIYSSTNWFTNYLTDSRFNQWERWVAQYNTSCHYKGEYAMWQCSSEGKVNGINGNVDLNIDYKNRGETRLVVKDGNTYCYKGNQMLFGVQKIKGGWYYFNETTGVMHTGWRSSGGKKFYYHEDGELAMGETKIGGSWYYFNSNGTMHTGWRNVGEKTYYYKGNGQLAIGKTEIDGIIYYFEKNGELQKD